ncbi:hypothetical protein ACFB49_04010 [Sphingomonas sp. DBB INV C78]|uniref:hypothetical protein n=1 Tax=Sphingomonas sp. DBB INV C78 TaxID=3349434 RepID=UPI0036D3201E
MGHTAILLAFLLANLAFLLWLCDRDGYEGDDLNSIVPMFHLAEAKAGLLLIYRYAWQPLSYELGAAMYRLTGSPDPIFLLAPIAGAISLTLLLWQGWRERPTRHGWLAVFALLLTIPEYWYSGLYYNSSILALPFLAGAVLVVRSTSDAKALFAAGLLAGIAALMRFDFILACPLLAAFTSTHSGRIAPIAVLAAGVVVALIVALATGIVDLSAIFDVYRASSAEIARKAGDPGWDIRAKLFVWTLTFTPFGWLILLVGGALGLWQANGAARRRIALYLLAAVPLLFPLKDMLSVKYALPLLAFAPMVLIRCLAAIEAALPTLWARLVPAALLGGGFLLAFISISLIGRPPFVLPGLMPARTIPTHDGGRSYGGYVWMMRALDAPAARTEAQDHAARLAGLFLGGKGPDIVIIGGENVFDRGGVGWRHLQLKLEGAGIHGDLVGRDQIRFAQGDRHLWLVGPTAPLPATSAEAIVIDERDPAG